jgi:hemoglobin
MDLWQTDVPEGLEAYRSTPQFTEASVPAGLLRAHATKAGVWGLLVVHAGRLLFVLEDEARDGVGDDESRGSARGPRARELAAGEQLAIAPTVRHHVELLDPDTCFQVVFHRRPLT